MVLWVEVLGLVGLGSQNLVVDKFFFNLWFSDLKFVEGFWQFWLWFVVVDLPLVVLGLVMGLLWIFGWVCFELCFGLLRMWWLCGGSGGGHWFILATVFCIGLSFKLILI